MSTTADDVTSAAARPLAAHHPTGISTGVFAAARGDWPELVACRVSTFAVEAASASTRSVPEAHHPRARERLVNELSEAEGQAALTRLVRERAAVEQWAEADDPGSVEDAWAAANAREAIRKEPW